MSDTRVATRPYIIGPSQTSFVVPAASGFEPETIAWASAVVGGGGTVTAPRETLVNTLVVGLKTDFGLTLGVSNLNTVFDRIWLLAAADQPSATFDIVGAQSWTQSGTIGFTADNSVFSNAGSFINSNYIPSTNGVTFTINSGHISAYILNSRGTSNITAFGAQSGAATDASVLAANAFGGTILFQINDAAQSQFGVSDSKGYWVVSRTAFNVLVPYLNGNTTPLTTTGALSVVLTQEALFICGLNNGGSGIQLSGDNHAAVTAGRGLTANEQHFLSNRINAYMTSLGINVY